MALNITTAVIGSGCNAATASPSLAQWDKGQILQISGVDLPETYKVEFSNGDTLEAIPAIGTAEGVEIPDKLLYSSSPIRAYIVLSEAEGERNTEYWVTIYVKPREIPEDIEPDPAQQDVIDDLIAQLNTGVGKAEAAAESAEEDAAAAEAASQAVQDLGVEAETLAPGAPAAVEKIVDAETGAVTLRFGLPRGADGDSPVVTVTTITGGHRVTVTDAAGAHSFDVMDGEDGRSVTGVTMGADYKLTFTFSDGTTWTTPTSIRGETGATPRFTIGVVSTLDPGQSATASITGTPEDPVLNLGIPKGQTGASDAGGVTYDPTESYQSGTAGAALNDLSRQLSDVETLVEQSPDSLISIVDFTVASATGLTYECDPVNGKVTLINGAASNYPSLSTGDILQNILEIGEEYTLHAKAVQTKGSPHLAMAVRTSASTIVKSYDFTANNTTEGTITFVAESNMAKISLFIGYGASTKGSQAEFSEIVLSESDGTTIDLLARNIADSHEKTISMQPLPIPFDSISDEAINALSGNVAASAGLFRTSYLDVSKYGLLYYKRIKVTGDSAEAGIAFYDKNYHYVGGRRFLLGQDERGYVDDKVIVPRNAVYARMTMQDKSTYGDFTLSGVIKSAYITERSSRDNNTARMEFSAHRGQRLYAPENSIPAYEIAGQMGYQWAWIAAIQVSADGTLYVMHDASVDRTTNGTGNVSSLTDVQINALKIDYVVSKQSRYVLSDFTDDELRVPTLEQIIQICLRYNMKMCFRLGGMPSSYVSAGDIAIWDSFAALIKGYRLEETSIFSGSIDQISIVRTLLPNGQVDYFGGSEADADDIIAAFSGYSALATNRSCIIYYENLTLADCKKLHINGFKINVGSGSSLSKADLKTMAEWGVDTVSYLYTPYIPYEEDI